MKTFCKLCNSSMRVSQSTPVTSGIRQFYATCKNEKCGAKWHGLVELDYQVAPAVSETGNELIQKILSLPIEVQKQLAETIKAAA